MRSHAYRYVSPSGWTPTTMPDQTGRLALVTGATHGIGLAMATELARHGAHVVLASRDTGRGKEAADRVREEAPDAEVEVRALDLSSLASIRAFRDDWDHNRLDLLVNNAGIAMVPFSRTEDGFESQFGVNHLGPFALTGLLMPWLLASSDPRVVTVSSESQRWVPLDLSRIDDPRADPAMAYGRSKKANVYFAVELQRRADAAGARLRSMAAIPGLTMTNLLEYGHVTGRSQAYRAVIRWFIRRLRRSPAEGALTALYAATAPGLPGGSYIAPGGLLELRGDPGPRDGHRAVYDIGTARRLWALSEDRTGVRYPL
ncbi:oxidoreductase [Streptosporangium sp. NPDC048865]|uniref:oxidoreductase n=1 Tax=Streptosporangium sp. NPDC048865 TaxID=3155766 RepID=UPI00341DF403